MLTKPISWYLQKKKRPDGLTSSAASGNTHWNTPQHTPNKHVKQEGCESSGKYWRKWLKTLIMFYFWDQNNLKIEPVRSIFNKTDAKPEETFWENVQRPEFVLILGPKVALKLDVWGPYSPHIWKYLQWAWEAILMWNQWKIFENDQIPEFWLI